MRITGMHSDEGKSMRTTFGTLWLLFALYGAANFFSGLAGMSSAGHEAAQAIPWEVLSLNFAINVLLRLAVGIMFLKSLRNGMLIVLAMVGYFPGRLLYEAFRASQAGVRFDVMANGIPLLTVIFVLFSAWACSMSCGARFTKVEEH